MIAAAAALARLKAPPADLVLAGAMGAILAALIVPLPPWLLDLGLALNLAAAVALLVTALSVRDALQVTAFPTLLLFTTLFRLALNVSSTRLALAEAHAGQVIQSFGEFVVRGDYLVGGVVFAILTLVQFLVVAKGAERVAEVAARFTLDAMPGKQMSIDVDLRAGAIDQAEARRRRRDLERESQMFGAMDGAMKFVKGDVIAGLVIVLVNLLGGLAVGVLQHGMTAQEALSTYALIAIGDGLVSQIPSLCIAVAAGLLVTRVAGDRADASLGADIGAQLFGRPRVLYVVAGLSAAIGLMPQMPHLTFLALAAAAAAAGRALERRARRPEAAAGDAPRAEAGTAPPGSESALPTGVSPLILDLAPDLAPLTTEDGSAFAKQELNALRDQLFLELGVRVPGVRVRTGATYLGPGQYALLIDEVPAGRGRISPQDAYASVPPHELAFLQIKAEADLDPATGKPCSRVPREAAPRLQAAQVQVRTARQVLLEHVLALLRKRAALFFGVQELQALLESFEPVAPALVKEALAKVPLPLLADVLRKLVREEVSIRNLRAILEALVSPLTEGDADALAEKCRQALHRALSHRHAPNGLLYAYLLDPAVEAVLREGGPKGLALDPEKVSAILESIRRLCASGKVVLLTAPDVRRTLRRLCEGTFPDVAVLTYAELDMELQIRPIGRLSAPVPARAA
ncbi:MAG TPA: flagellar biosynthesis protein FlhA [Myxococcales bacterium]|nr:flagellar biosynthesis protein FlhA [Myxococcales bacterium]